MVARHAGPEAVELLGTYWTHGDADVMRARCADAGLRVAAVHEHECPAYFPNIETMVLTEVNATPLRDRVDQAVLDRILAESHEVLGQFVQEGRLVIPLAGYVLAASPRLKPRENIGSADARDPGWQALRHIACRRAGCIRIMPASGRHRPPAPTVIGGLDVGHHDPVVKAHLRPRRLSCCTWPRATRFSARHEHKLASILNLSSSTADYINRLRKDGFDVREFDRLG